MKQRVVLPPQGVYQDYRAVVPSVPDVPAAKAAGVQIFLGSSQTAFHEGVLFLDAKPANLPSLVAPGGVDATNPKELRKLKSRLKSFPAEAFDATGGRWRGHPDLQFRYSSSHVLARELTAAAVQASLTEGRAYAANDWLCDPAGFYFVAQNNLGVYDIGDTAPLMNGTRLLVNLPIPATIQVLRDGAMVAEAADSRLAFPVEQEGSYRLEISVSLAGERRPWISTNAIRVGKSDLQAPSGEISPDVAVHDDGPYALFLPKSRNFPVLIFFHGGVWHPLIANRLAKAGIGVVVPREPLKTEEAAAAIAWVHQHIAEYGGDASRIFIGGHSAGAGVAALLALDPEWLEKYGISPGAIRGVVSLSGVYDLKDPNASPIRYVHPRTPPFLVTYCQWDYLGFPKQARDFAAALQKEFDSTRVVYIPGENHISEMLSIAKDGDMTARAILDFVK